MTSTPYPRLGECVRALASALDSKTSDRDVDRLAREGDFDWSVLDTVIGRLLIDGTVRLLAASVRPTFEAWLHSARDAYCRLVMGVALDGIDREEALPVLIDRFFVPVTASLLRAMNEQCRGPGLDRLLTTGTSPVSATLDWLDDVVGEPIDKLLYPETVGESKSTRDKMGKWRAGVDLPSAHGLKLLLDAMRAEPRSLALADAAGVWLLTARALAHFERLGGERVRAGLDSCLRAGVPAGAAGERLLELVRTSGRRWPELADAGRRLWHDLRRTTTKHPGERADTWGRIMVLERLARELDPEGTTAYHVAWMRGRWHVLAGLYEEALAHYEEAFRLSCYRAGHQVREVAEDAMCIAAFLGKRPILKRMKHVGIALGLFVRPDVDAALEDWEIEQFSQQLLLRFPPQGRFVESEADLSPVAAPGLMLISAQSVDRMKPDLSAPNRVRAIRFENGIVRRWPQLRLFASFGMAANVSALLDAGASVDELDGSGGSALLCGIQHAHATGDRSTLDLLLAVPHAPATLNTITGRKGLTPLVSAIDFGQPDVVQRLLEMGADADLPALTDRQSPLYYAVTLLHGRIHPQRMLTQLSLQLAHGLDAAGRETLRRFGVAWAGPFGDDASLVHAEPELAAESVKAMVDRHVARHSVEKLQRIIALLLRFGADPNRSHRYPTPGRTPLMVAAESDLAAIFEMMMDNRGDPLKPDADGKNCHHIAAGFRSYRVLAILARMGT